MRTPIPSLTVGLVSLASACGPHPVPVAPTEPALPAPPAFRLPGDVRPTAYRLEQTILPATDHVDGELSIDVTVVTPTRVVWLNATDLTVSRATIDGHAMRVVPGGESFVGIQTLEPLAVGPHVIELAYRAKLDHEHSRGTYAEREPDGSVYAYTFFESIDARRAFPCFDEPAYKVPWQLTFHVAATDVALGNAAVTREVPEPHGMKRVELAPTKPLPSYLVAYVVGPFEVIDGGVTDGVPIRFIAPKGRSGELGYARAVTPRVVAALDAYFDIDYPYGKLDVAIVPRYWGTMEHPGIVAMGQPLSLIRPEQASRERREHYANVLAHELSHYWFGDLVTMAWWDDTWLNEALGEWNDLHITQAAEPTWRMLDERVGISVEAFAADEKLGTHAIRRPVLKQADIDGSFDAAITYFKGASILRMFEAYVTPDAWRAFINAYLAAHRWGNASADDFTAAMRASLSPLVADAFRTFVDQPGVPLVEVTAHCDRHELVITQRRSLPAGVVDREAHAWTIPATIRYGDATHTETIRSLSSAPEAALPMTLCPTWIVPNVDARGYYRSKLDAASIQHLFAPGGGSTAEKLMAIADQRAAVDRGELTIDKLLDLAPLAAADPDDLVAHAAFDASSTRYDALDDALDRAGRAYRTGLFAATARRLGWTRAPGDTDERHRVRIAALAVVAPRDDVLGPEAERLADAWLGSHAGLDDELVDVALRVAIERGDAGRIDRYVAAARVARDHTEQVRILAALGATRDPVLATRVLGLVAATELDIRDTQGLVGALAAHRETLDATLAWLEAHLDGVLARMRSDEASWLLESVASAPCDPAHAARARAVLEPRVARIDGAATLVTRALEGADLCAANMARQEPALRAFFAAVSSGPLRPTPHHR